MTLACHRMLDKVLGDEYEISLIWESHRADSMPKAAELAKMAALKALATFCTHAK